MSNPTDLDSLNVAAHQKAAEASPPPQKRMPRGKATLNHNINNVNNTHNQESTMSKNNNPSPAPVAVAAPKKEGRGFAHGIDTGLYHADRAAGFVGRLLVPGAAGAGIGYGIVRAAGDNIPDPRAKIAVIAGAAILMIAGKLVVQALAANAVHKSGHLTARERWSVRQAETYIEAARKAGVTEEQIYNDLLEMQVVEKAEAPAQAQVAVAV